MTPLSTGKKIPWYRKKTALRKALISATITLALVFSAALLVQRVLLPAFIVFTIRPNEEPSPLIPERFLPSLYKARNEVAGHIDHLPEMLDSLGMDTHELLTLTESIDYSHIGDAIKEMRLVPLTSIDDVFSIIVRNVQVEGHDLEKFRPTFTKRIELHQVQRVLNKLDDPLVITLAAPTIKATLVRLLHENKEEIHENHTNLQKMKQAP